MWLLCVRINRAFKNRRFEPQFPCDSAHIWGIMQGMGGKLGGYLLEQFSCLVIPFDTSLYTKCEGIQAPSL